jgi:hypothetical protein
MSIESEVAALTAATTDLLSEVVLKKNELKNNASAITYGGTYATVKDALDALLYIPVDVTAYSLNTTSAELGSTVSGLAITWNVNKVVTSQTMNGANISAASRTFNPVGSFTSNQTWTLVASDGSTSDSGTASLAFQQKRYWGTSNLTSLTDSQIIALSGGSELSTTKNKSVSYDASGGKYPYYCFPASFGTLGAVTVNGLSFSDYTVTSKTFVNASGYSSTYSIVRFNSIQNGSSISVTWA